MSLNLSEHTRTELFETQKKLIRTIAVISFLVIVVAGAAMHFIDPPSSMGMPLRFGFAIIFGLTAYFSGKKKTSTHIAELMLSLSGAVLLSKILFQYYDSGFTPTQLVSCTLILLAFSGVFINKSSLAILYLPAVSFIFYASIFPHPLPLYPASIGFIFLSISTIVGYFLTWQKVYLLRKCLAHEIHKNTVINNLHEGVLLQDPTGRTLAVNQSLGQILNLSRDQLRPQSTHDILDCLYKSDGITPCPLEERPSNLAKETGKVVKDYPMSLKNSDQSLTHVDVTAIPIMSNSKSDKVKSILITFRNVTELKKAQEVIENQKIHSLAHAKLTALGEMAAGIAHEINNPLTIILGRTAHTQKLIQQGRSTNSDLLLNLEKINSTTLRIAKIVKSMKALSRDTNGEEFQLANLKEIIDDIITVSNEYIVKNEIKVTIEIPADLNLECNPGLLSQVFINLVSNAIDAIKEIDHARWIRAEARLQDGRAIVSFYDSGPGIPKELKDKIMLPFFTTKEAGKGTGIGLSLCRTIIENHGGRFYVNDLAATTCFTVEIPTHQNSKKMPQISVA